MKKIGILGGVGWASTIDYYRAICQGASAHFAARGAGSPLPVPPMSIESVVQAETRALRGRPGDEGSWERFDAVFRAALLRLEVSGCDFAVIASNTPHARLHAIRRGVRMPILSIFTETARATRDAGAGAALVLGTSVTMQARDYAGALAEQGVAANDILSGPAIDRMQGLIDTDFYGGASPDARAKLLDFCREHARSGDAIILACTELPLAFPEHTDDVSFHTEGFHFINPSAAHVAAALRDALGQNVGEA